MPRKPSLKKQMEQRVTELENKILDLKSAVLAIKLEELKWEMRCREIQREEVLGRLKIARNTFQNFIEESKIES